MGDCCCCPRRRWCGTQALEVAQVHEEGPRMDQPASGGGGERAHAPADLDAAHQAYEGRESVRDPRPRYLCCRVQRFDVLVTKNGPQDCWLLGGCAHRAYTEYLQAVDNGDIPNKPAGAIAKQYYHLPDDATLRDVILHVRADECMHRDFNHHLSDLYDRNEGDVFPTKMGLDSADEATKEEEASAAAGAASGGGLNLRGTPAAAKEKSHALAFFFFLSAATLRHDDTRVAQTAPPAPFSVSQF